MWARLWDVWKGSVCCWWLAPLCSEFKNPSYFSSGYLCTQPQPHHPITNSSPGHPSLSSSLQHSISNTLNIPNHTTIMTYGHRHYSSIYILSELRGFTTNSCRMFFICNYINILHELCLYLLIFTYLSDKPYNTNSVSEPYWVDMSINGCLASHWAFRCTNHSRRQKDKLLSWMKDGEDWQWVGLGKYE